MAAGTITSRELVERSLRRRSTSSTPSSWAWPTTTSRPPCAAADALDAERRPGTVRGPLHGIPITVKDVIDVAGLTDPGRLADLRRPTRARRRGGRPAAAGRRGDPRQGRDPRVRARGHLTRRAATPTTPPGSPAARAAARRSRVATGHGPRLARHRHPGVDPGARRAVRRRRPQADLRAGAHRRRRHPVVDDGPRRADGRDRRRRRHHARRPRPCPRAGRLARPRRRRRRHPACASAPSAWPSTRPTPRSPPRSRPRPRRPRRRRVHGRRPPTGPTPATSTWPTPPAWS